VTTSGCLKSAEELFGFRAGLSAEHDGWQFATTAVGHHGLCRLPELGVAGDDETIKLLGQVVLLQRPAIELDGGSCLARLFQSLSDRATAPPA
jgi:hypothetical protein